MQISEDFTTVKTWNHPLGMAQASVYRRHILRWTPLERNVHVAALLGINSFLRKGNLVYKTTLGESAIVNPETVMDWKSERLPKIINVK
jgi:hypothetical protein